MGGIFLYSLPSLLSISFFDRPAFFLPLCVTRLIMCAAAADSVYEALGEPLVSVSYVNKRSKVLLDTATILASV